MNKLFIILGNQLFNPKYFEKYKDHIFFLAEDYDLCTYERHHKHKILLFLSAMRSFCDELRDKNFEVTYQSIEDSDFKISYEDKIRKIAKEFQVSEISMFEITYLRENSAARPVLRVIARKPGWRFTGRRKSIKVT